MAVDHDLILPVSIALFLVVSSIIGFVWKIWPIIHNIDNVLNDLGGEPARPGRPARPGVMERLAKVEEHAEAASFHSKPNHGSSSYDKLTTKIDDISAMLEEHVSESTQDRARIWTVLKAVTAVPSREVKPPREPQPPQSQ